MFTRFSKYQWMNVFILYKKLFYPSVIIIFSDETSSLDRLEEMMRIILIDPVLFLPIKILFVTIPQKFLIKLTNDVKINLKGLPSR